MNIYRYQPYVDKLFSPQDKKYYHKQRKNLESDVLLLTEKLNQLVTVSKQIKNDLIGEEELYKIKYNIIDSFWSNKRKDYFELLNLYENECNEIHNLQEKIVYLKSKLKSQIELKQTIQEENQEINDIFDFSDFPQCSSSLSTKIIKIESDSLPISTSQKVISDDLEPIIDLNETKLIELRKKLLNYDNSIDFSNQQKFAASLMSTAQNSFTKQCEINSKLTDYSIDEFKQILNETDETNRNLLLDIEHLRQQKFKLEFAFENNKASLSSLHKAHIEIFKKHIMKYKHKIKMLKRSINEKADQYDSNCKQLLDTFSQYEKCLNDRDEQIENSGVVNDTIIEEEEMNDDNNQVKLINDLIHKKQSIEMDIQNLKNQLSQRRFLAKKNSLQLLDDIEILKKKDVKYQKIINDELNTMKTENTKFIDHDFNRIKHSIFVFNDFVEQ